MLQRVSELENENVLLKNNLAITTNNLTITTKNLASQTAETAKRDLMIIELQNKLKLALIRRFARQADSYVDPNAPKQDDLFDELPLPEVVEAEPEVIEVPAHSKVKKARGKRKPLPEELERIQQFYRLPEADLLGPNGEQFIEIGQEMTEQLDVIPADVKVIQHIRIKYAVKGQEELGVKIAPMAPTILPKSIATPGLLAHIAQAKYCHHLPLYRQEAIWKELDVHLPRNSLCRWMMEVGERVSPLIEYLFADMKTKGYLHVDETPVTVLEDAHKKPENPSHQGYIWVYANSIGVLYDYRSSREGAHPLSMLEDFKGYVQKDGYAGYDALFRNTDRIGVGCMAHLRRKFTDIQKVTGKKSRSSVADHVVNLIAKLYHLESVAKKENQTDAEIYEMRQEKAKLILTKLHDYLKEQSQKAPPQSMLGKAIQYSLNQWQAVIRYTDQGMLNIDNNPAERCIRPFTIGRKNWLFCGNTRGAIAAANLYSLIESAKLYDLKIFDYLKFIFTELPNADTPRKLEQLLPHHAHVHLPKIKKSQSV